MQSCDLFGKDEFRIVEPAYHLMLTRRYQQRMLVIFAALLLCVGGVFALTATQQGNVLLLDGKKTPLLFARNGPDAQDLAAYHALGFNTLLVQIGSPGPTPLANAESLMNAAEHEGLYVLVELSNGRWSDAQSPDARTAEYQQAATRYLDNVIPLLAKHTNLVGWVISTVDEGKFACNVLTFVDYLRQKYGGEAEVLDAWSVKDNDGNVTQSPQQFTFALMSVMSLNAYIAAFARYKEVGERIREDYTAFEALGTDRDKAFQQYLAQRYQSPSSVATAWRCANNWAVHDWKDLSQHSILKHEHDRPGSSPASLLALANYQASFSPALMNWWASEVKKRDAEHLLFAGAQFSYRTIISLPHSLNGVLTECYPGVAEADIDTQNPQAIDIARRGNQFIVLAGILAQDIDTRRLTNAIVTAAVHGAAGLCLTDWPALSAPPRGNASADTCSAVQSTFAALRANHLLGMTPATKSAIVYEPYLPGPPGARAHGLYGYLTPTMLFPSPHMPFATFSNGTAAGQVDYLAASDLLNTALLNRYAVVILPSVFDLPVNDDPQQDTQQALLNYVRQAGHTVVADLGVGTMQANQDFCNLPPTMIQLFNLRNVTKTIGIERANMNLSLDQPFTERFPSLRPGYRTNGTASGYVVSRFLPMLPLPRTQLLFDLVKGTGFTRPTVHTPTILALEPTRGAFIFHQSQDTQTPANGGYALFFPFALYQNWIPGLDPIFGAFHRDLMGLNADAILTRPTDFFPQLTEMSTYADGSLIIWTKQQTRPALTINTPERRLYLTPEGQGDLGPQATNFQFHAAGFHLLRPLPLSPSDITTPPFSYSVTQYAASGIDISIFGSGDGQVRPYTLQLFTGAYQVKPGSQHQAIITTPSAAQNLTLTADTDPTIPNKGILTLTLPAGECRMQLTPIYSGDSNDVVVKVHSLDDIDLTMDLHKLDNTDITVDLHKLDDTEPIVEVKPLVGGKK